MQTKLKNEVTHVPAAPSAAARTHFGARLGFETDCADVHAALGLELRDFVVVDVRGPAAYQAGHVPGAVSIPHWKITGESLHEYPADITFVVYCAGPHCNGSTKAALRLAALSRPVKEMIGGIEGWKDEGFELVTS